MTMELSKKVEITGVATLKSAIVTKKVYHHADASTEAELVFWRNFENELGEMAAKVGYQPGDSFRYKVTVEKLG